MGTLSKWIKDFLQSHIIKVYHIDSGTKNKCNLKKGKLKLFLYVYILHLDTYNVRTVRHACGCDMHIICTLLWMCTLLEMPVVYQATLKV